ncbi:MAG: Fur family transcriptional regulator [Cyanobacteriota bacterium]
MKNSCLTTKEIENVLKSKGIQPTAQRIAVCKYVLCDADHPNVDEVKAWADENFPKISLATVYNTMNILVEVGLIKTLRFPHSDKAIFDNNTSIHHHFIDEKTSKIYDISSDEVEVKSKLSNDFEVKEYSVLLVGNKV